MEKTFDTTQVMLAHAFAAYVGSGSFSFLKNHVNEVEQAIESALTQWPALTQDGWDMVWGPAYSRLLPVSLFDINLMVLLQCQSNPHHFVLAIRGTNPFSLPNWLLEDFFVQQQRPWLFSPGVVRPSISQATFNGLHELSSAVTDRGKWFKQNPSAVPVTLLEMIDLKLKELGKTKGEPITLSITGHSLGGALAPTMGLWLADTQSSWDSMGRVTIEVFSFAGPSPGNASFAAHFHDMFKDRYHGIVNENDIVTKGWELDSTRDIPRQYAPAVKANFATNLFFQALAYPLKKTHYKRLTPGLESFIGKILPELDSFWLQAIYQHSVAYLEAFNLVPKHMSKDKAVKMTWEDIRSILALSQSTRSLKKQVA